MLFLTWQSKKSLYLHKIILFQYVETTATVVQAKIRVGTALPVWQRMGSHTSTVFENKLREKVGLFSSLITR